MYSTSGSGTARIVLAASVALGGILWSTVGNLSSATAGSPPPGSPPSTIAGAIEYTPEGKMKRPPFSAFRHWVYIGTPLTPNDMNDGKANFPEFHNVYMDPEGFAYYEKNGKYRDGTAIVKELVSVGTKEAASGSGYFQGEFIGLEVSVKDSKLFPKDPGNWGFFSFGHSYPLKDVSKPNKVDECNKCHETNAIDFVFSQYYPVLRAANPMKK